ncbi:MAG: PspC domain-containing protein, partial [Acidimicrobiaceae bacterium]|nr:PspC domain-containing protein [Acidimicrobiaceae bacterium]
MAEEQPDPRPEDPGPDADPDPTEGASAEGATARRRTLCRSSTDKVVAGVAGGIGAYFGIDSVIVRIAFIVLTFLGGAGPFLYLIGWLALPKEDSRSIVAKALGGDSPHRFRSVMAVILIGLGLLITANLSSGLFGLLVDVWSIAPYLALLLIAAGVALV